MSWDKIEEHLFDKYCVEGKDEELCSLMEEHDKEVRDDILQKVKKRINLLDPQLYDEDEIINIKGAVNEIIAILKGEMVGFKELEEDYEYDLNE